MGRRPKVAPAPGAGSPERPRVLFLHGYTSNSALFQAKLAPLLRALGGAVEPVFLTAPHRAYASWVEDAADELGERGAACSWFRDEPAAADDGWAETLAAIRAASPEGFDGVLGFSQGCRAALRLCAQPELLGGSRRPRFVALCSAPKCGADAAACLAIPSLHVFGDADTLVPRALSEAVMAACTEGGAAPVVFAHPGAHAVPTSPEFARLLAAFIASATAPAGVLPPAAAAASSPAPLQPARRPRPPPPPAAPPPPPARAHAALIGELEEEARTELEALRAILGDELHVGPDRDSPNGERAPADEEPAVPDGTAGGSELDPATAARLTVLLRADPECGGPDDGGVRLGARLYLELLLPARYPSAQSLAGCACLLVEPEPSAPCGGSPLPAHFAPALAAHLDGAARAGAGCAAAYELITAAKDWVANACDGRRPLEPAEGEEGEEEGAAGSQPRRQEAGAALGLPTRRLEGSASGALPPALCASLAAVPSDWRGVRAHAAADSAALAPSPQPAGGSRSGRWRFTVGLVGKPSAGKSSFFNAATATVQAKVGAHPFTTIEPNCGVALVHVPAPTGSPVQSVMVPIVLKDVAGLVPGACDGRGRGNRFLNDLCDADALVHITDASASADANGNLLVDPAPLHDGAPASAEPDGAADSAEPARAAGTSCMREDVAWVHRELFRWVYDNVASAWDKVLRRPAHLFNLFTGYQCAPSLAEEALRTCSPAPPPLESAREWTADDVASLIDSFLALRFATVICANKADLPAARAQVAALRAELRGLAPQLARSVVAASALCEGELQRLGWAGIAAREVAAPLAHAAEGAPSSGDEGAASEHRVLVRLSGQAPAGDGGDGRLAPRDVAALELAARCGYSLCADEANGGRAALAQLRPSGAPAARIAGGVQATLQRAFWLRPPVVVFPVCELATARSYPLSEAALREGGGASADRAHVRDVVLLRPGSTVWDLFSILLHAPYKLLGGEFVRAEGRPLREPRAVRQLRKDEPLAQGFVVRFYSTRKGQRVKQ